MRQTATAASSCVCSFVFARIVGLARRDVVDVGHHVVGCVDVVKAERAARLLGRNRAPRLVFTLLLFLRTTLRLRVRTEVAAPRRRTAGGAAARVERTPAAERSRRP